VLCRGSAGANDLESPGPLREDLKLGLGARRITLNPDCGFAPGSAAKVDLDEVYLKLRAEVEAARILRERHP
jgi:5-methyltetrahydropteroyltriglutamate--homocysteine methyltransferase